MENYIKRNGRKLILLWICLIVTGTFIIGYFSIAYLGQNRDAKLQILKKVYQKVETSTEDSKPSQAVKVKTGIYASRISEMRIKDSEWIVDFYVWFTWKGDDIEDPGETVEVMDGEILSKEKLQISQNGDTHYAQYKIQAKITKIFDVQSYPADSHLLTIALEDANNDLQHFQYVVDTYEYAPNLAVLGYQLKGSRAWVEEHTYHTNFGDPNIAPGQDSVYSQFMYIIAIKRLGWGYYMKMFQGLFASILLALASFLSRPSEKSDRLALGVGSFFAAIANTYFAQNVLPDSGIMTLMDLVNGISYTMILMIIISSVISTYLYELDDKMGLLMDRLALVTFTLCYVGLNIALPLSTMW